MEHESLFEKKGWGEVIISGMDTLNVVDMLADFYSIERTLQRKGYVVGGMDDSSRVIATSDAMYERLKRRSRRRVLRSVYQEACRDFLSIQTKYSQFTKAKVSQIVEELSTVGALKVDQDTVQPIDARDLGVTFEWFIAEVVKRELGGTAAFGVHIRELRTGGDFDVIARLEDVVVYLECKAGSLGNISGTQITEFIDRDGELSPDLTLYVVDTDGLTEEFKRLWVAAGWSNRGMGACRPKIREIRGRGKFYEATSSKFIVTNDRNLISNIRLAVNHHHRFVKRYGMIGPNDEALREAYDEYEED